MDRIAQLSPLLDVLVDEYVDRLLRGTVTEQKATVRSNAQSLKYEEHGDYRNEPHDHNRAPPDS